MARYIDLEELERRIKKYVKPEIPEEKAFVEYYKDECIRQGYAMPTADVVPKSEVDKLIAEAKAEVAREIFEEIERVIGEKYEYYVFDNNDLDSIEQDAIINFSDTLSACFDELKEKYTEEKV